MSFNLLESGSYRQHTPRRWVRQIVEDMPAVGRSWEQAALLLLCALLLSLVVLACTGYLALSLACGILAGLALVGVTLARPHIALLLVFLGAGLPSLLIPVPGHTMRLLEAPLVLCLALIIVHRPTMRLRLPHALALLFLAIALISFLHMPVIAHLLNDYGADKRLYAWALILLAFFGGTLLATSIKNLSSFFCLVLLVHVPYVLIGAAQALHIHLPPLLIPSTALEVTRAGRLSGPADSPTTFAFYLVDLLTVALVCWTLGERRWHRWTGAAFLPLIVWELLGSGTRSAVGTALVLTILVLLITRRFKWLVGLGVLALPLTFLVFNTVASRFLHGNVSIANRLFLWQQALKLIAANPWIGIGLEQFPTYYVKLIVGQAAELNPAGIGVHNQYLELALESGISWLLIGLLLLFSLAWFCWKTYRRAGRGHRMALLATLLLILATLTISVVDVPLDKVEGTVFLFLLAGIALGYTAPACVPGNARSRTHAPGTHERPVPEQSKPDASVTLRRPKSWLRAAKAQSDPYVALPGHLLLNDTLPSQLTAPLPVLHTLAGDVQSVPKAGRAVLIQIISWAIALPILFPCTALMTRYFGPQQYGEYSFTLAILAVCALGTMTGMDSWLIRDVSRQKRSAWSKSLGEAAAARLLTSLLMSGLAALVIYVLPLGNEQRGLLLLGVGTLTFSFSLNGLRAIYECGFVAEQQMGALALITTINRVATAGLILLAVSLHLSLTWTYLLLAYSDLPSFFALLLLARRRFQIHLRFDFPRIWQIVRESLPFTGYDALALFAGQIDVLLLLPLAGSLSVGFYALALRITNPLFTIAFAYVGGLYPYLCARFARGREEFARIYHEATRILALGMIPLTLFIVTEAPAVVRLLAGDHYTAAITPTRFLMIATALAFCSQVALRACMAANKEKVIPLISAVTLAITLAANALLIPRWQASGASVAALLVELLSVCFFSALLLHHVHLRQTLGVVLQVLLGNLPGLAFLLWQPQLPLVLLAAGQGLLAMAGCMLTRTLSLKDFQMARQIVGTRLTKGKR